MSTKDKVNLWILGFCLLLFLAALVMLGYTIGQRAMCESFGGLYFQGICVENPYQELRP